MTCWYIVWDMSRTFIILHRPLVKITTVKNIITSFLDLTKQYVCGLTKTLSLKCSNILKVIAKFVNYLYKWVLKKSWSNHWALQDYFHTLPIDLTFPIYFHFWYDNMWAGAAAVRLADQRMCEEALDLCCHLSLRPSRRLQRWTGTQLLVKARWC